MDLESVDNVTIAEDTNDSSGLQQHLDLSQDGMALQVCYSYSAGIDFSANFV